jgi:hypothetical protein
MKPLPLHQGRLLTYRSFTYTPSPWCGISSLRVSNETTSYFDSALQTQCVADIGNRRFFRASPK